MTVFIRTDSSKQIGSGHLMRCISLANELRIRGCDVHFICRDFNDNLGYKVKQADHFLHLVPHAESENALKCGEPIHEGWLGASWLSDAELTIEVVKSHQVPWLVVDHYALDYRWHQEIRPFVENIMVIDDLANRKLDCDILLDQNYYTSPERRYDGRIPRECDCLLGPAYLLLKSGFLEARRNPVKTHEPVKNLLVSMGGSDKDNETEKILRALDSMSYKFERVDVVAGALNMHSEELRSLCLQRKGFFFHQNVGYMEQLCDKADFAIGTGGVSTLERCYVGLPSAVFTIAENQIETNEALHEVGAVKYLGWINEISHSEIANSIDKLISDRESLAAMIGGASKIFGDKGFQGPKGVVDKMFEKARLR